MAEAAQPLEALVLGVLTESDMTSIEQEFSKPLVKVRDMRDSGCARLPSYTFASMATTTYAVTIPPSPPLPCSVRQRLARQQCEQSSVC